MIKKGLAVAVILLFIGVAFAPSINAELVVRGTDKYSIEFVGSDKSYTVSSEQLIQIDALIQEYHKASDSNKDILALLKDIKDIGVISDVDFQLFNLCHQIFQYINNKLVNRITPHHQAGSHRNLICSVVATMDGYGRKFCDHAFSYGFIPLFPPIGLLIYLLPNFYYVPIIFDYYRLNGLIPLQLLGMVFFGSKGIETEYATGTITTSGTNGVITSEGQFLGNLHFKKNIWDDSGKKTITIYVAMLGFMGLKIPIIEINNYGILKIKGHQIIGFSLFTNFDEV